MLAEADAGCCLQAHEQQVKSSILSVQIVHTSDGHWLGPCSGSLASSLSAAMSLPKYSPVQSQHKLQSLDMTGRTSAVQLASYACVLTRATDRWSDAGCISTSQELLMRTGSGKLVSTYGRHLLLCHPVTGAQGPASLQPWVCSPCSALFSSDIASYKVFPNHCQVDLSAGRLITMVHQHCIMSSTPTAAQRFTS